MIVRPRNGALFRQLQTLYNLGTISDLTDGQLLERFEADADDVAELAFSALVERHEAMVWRVCLAILRDEHEAEDAFQATFLVLVRKSRSLWVRDSLGPWLHQVACRTASCLRSTIIRRRKHERRCAAMDGAGSVEVGTRGHDDRDAVVHEEVNRLPEKYRSPVVLCDLEGRTHQEAARFLHWPIGTVKSRQSKGRELLRDQLLRRGLGLAVTGAVVDSLRQTAIAAMPKEVSWSTVNAAMQQSARLLTGFGVSANVLTLTQGVLQAMLWIRLRYLALITLAVGVASGGVSVYVCGSQEPAPKNGQSASKRTTTTNAQTPHPKMSKNSTGWSATTRPQAELRAQQLATRKAKACYEIAKLSRELARMVVEEYEEVNYPRDLATVGAEIKRAESDLAGSEAKLNGKKAKFALELAQSKRDVLMKYTKLKTARELESEVEKARSDELAKKAAWDAEKSKEIELERQLRQRTNLTD